MNIWGLIYIGMTDVAGENKEAKSLFRFVSGLCPSYYILIKKIFIWIHKDTISLWKSYKTHLLFSFDDIFFFTSLILHFLSEY